MSAGEKFDKKEKPTGYPKTRILRKSTTERRRLSYCEIIRLHTLQKEKWKKTKRTEVYNRRSRKTSRDD